MDINKTNIVKFLLVIFLGWSIILGVYITSKHYQIQINVSDSMYKKIWVTHVGNTDVKRGDFVVVKFHDYRMKNSTDYELVVKQIGGVGGDNIIVRDWVGYAEGVEKPNKTTWMYVLPEGAYPTYDTLSGYHFTPLTTKNMIIPMGYYFLHGQHHPSFDSRYKEFGLINKNQILGKAYPLF